MKTLFIIFITLVAVTTVIVNIRSEQLSRRVGTTKIKEDIKDEKDIHKKMH